MLKQGKFGDSITDYSMILRIGRYNGYSVFKLLCHLEKSVIISATYNKKRIYFLCKLERGGKNSCLTRLNKKPKTGIDVAEKFC